MALVGFARDRFEQVLKERLSATKPISRVPNFCGGAERKLEPFAPMGGTFSFMADRGQFVGFIASSINQRTNDRYF